MQMTKKLIILGAGGHAKVVAEIALKCGYEVVGFLDDSQKVTEINGISVIGKIDACESFKDCEFIIAIGNNLVRKNLSEKYALKWATLIHPSAQIGFGVKIDEGSVVMPNAVINPSAKVGKHSIINTAAVVEHDCIVGDYTHLSPAATICGTVKVGSLVHVGTGATVINNVNICSSVLVGAGAVVVKDITESGTYVGVPAKLMIR